MGFGHFADVGIELCTGHVVPSASLEQRKFTYNFTVKNESLDRLDFIYLFFPRRFHFGRV